jgi:N-acetylglucosamine transport system substrate-binding protein
MKGIAPPDFTMTAAPVPALDSGSAMPVTALRTQPTEAFIVPARAKNVNGGLDYLRLMMSKEGASKFAELTASVPSVSGVEVGAGATPALQSVSAALDAAGNDVFSWQINTWYVNFWKTVLQQQLGNLLAGRIDANTFISTVQSESDRLAADQNVPKFQR